MRFLQAKNASISNGLVSSTRGAIDNGLLDLLEGKLAILLFQIKIKDELEAIAFRIEHALRPITKGADLSNNTRQKAKELPSD